jgi:hypothetical protein
MSNKSEPCYFYDYHPYHEGENPEFNRPTDGKIMDVKSKYPSVRIKGINHFVPKLQNILSRTDYVICVIPSSKVGFEPSGIRSIAEQICCDPIVDGTKVSHRIIEMEPKSMGGARDIDLEIPSLEVMNESLIKNKQVLLLDDVTTSGTSFDAGHKLLEEAGAGLIVKLALGKTV